MPASSLPDLTDSLLAGGDTQGCETRRMRVLGRHIDVHSNVPRFIEILDASCSEFYSTPGQESADPMYVVRRKVEDDICLADPGYRSILCDDPLDAFYFWSGQIGGNRLFRGRHLLIHGSALCRNDETWVFAGPSRAGKTSLALRLAGSGFLLLSDEFVPLDPETDCVETFRRALFVREATLNALGAQAPDVSGCVSLVEPDGAEPEGPSGRRVILEAARLSPCPAPVPPVAGICFLAGFGADETHATRLAPVAALARLTECLVNASHLSTKRRCAAIACLGRLLARVPGRAVVLGPPDEPLSTLVEGLTCPVALPDDVEQRHLADVVARSLSGLQGA